MAFTTIPSSGAKFRAAVLSSLITEVRPLVVRKAIDEITNTNATLQNDNELFLVVAANSVYELDMRVLFNSTSTADFKYGFSFPSGLTMSYTQTVIGVGLTALNTFEQIQTDTPALEGQGAVKGFLIRGIVTVVTAGTLQFQWAQNTSNGIDTTVKGGSHMRLIKLS